MEMDRRLELIRKVQKVGKRLMSDRESVLSDIGVTPTQSSALLFIAATPRCRITDLGESMEISHQAARMLVERMVERGFLETTVDDEDARAKKKSTIILQEYTNSVKKAFIAPPEMNTQLKILSSKKSEMLVY